MADTVSSDSNRVHKIYWTHGDQPCWMGQIWIRFCGYDDPAQRILQFLSLCKIYCSGRGLAGYEEILQKEGSKNIAFLLFYADDRSVFYILPGHKYRNVGALCKDIVTHVFCVAPNWSDTYISTSFNGVLWTVQMEVIYYLLLPWIARLFRKWAFATYSVMLMISVTSTAVILNCFAGKERNYGNNILTFMGIYANGMLCCILYVMWKKYVTENKYSRLAGTVISVLCIF